MKVNYFHSKGRIIFKFYPSDEDKIIKSKASMANNECFVELPCDWSVESVHPDLLALCIVLIIYPFVKSEILLPFGVSLKFSETFLQLTRKKLLPVNENLRPRVTPDNSVPALAYSAGVDSTAALLILPSNTCLFFSDRIKPEGFVSNYKKDAVYFACDYLKKTGRQVYIIPTDFEFVRQPPGFPIDVSNAIPAILMADYSRLDSIAFGTVAESAYRIGHEIFQDYEQRHHYKTWGKLFETAGMPFNLVTAGISEVGTTIITMNSSLGFIAQSCMRGEVQKPCMKCYKCIRKLLLEKALQNEKYDEGKLNEMICSPGIPQALLKTPIHHGNIFGYITSRYKGSNRIMTLLKKKTGGDKDDFTWLEKWYSPSINMIFARYGPYVEGRIKQYLQSMNGIDELKMNKLNLEQFLVSEDYKKINDELAKAFEAVL